MAFFSADTLDMLRDNLATVTSRSHQIVETYAYRPYSHDRSREFARHGFSRRILTLARCIRRVFEFIPPDQTDIPAEDLVEDATVYIQAFVFNAFGAIDNLAWIWVIEANVRSEKDEELSPIFIGLWPKNKLVRASLKPKMQAYLAGLDEWFRHMEDFRHALGHRIPLFVPPYFIPHNVDAAYMALDKQKWAAVRDPNEYERLKAEQRKLAIFQPMMKHTLYDKKGSVVFHCQLLQDFATIEEIAQYLAEELDALPR